MSYLTNRLGKVLTDAKIQDCTTFDQVDDIFEAADENLLQSVRDLTRKAIVAATKVPYTSIKPINDKLVIATCTVQVKLNSIFQHLYRTIVNAGFVCTRKPFRSFTHDSQVKNTIFNEFRSELRKHKEGNLYSTDSIRLLVNKPNININATKIRVSNIDSDSKYLIATLEIFFDIN